MNIVKFADLTCTNIYLSGNSLAVTVRSALGSSVGLMTVKRIAKGVFVQTSEYGTWILGLQEGEAKETIQDGEAKEKIQFGGAKGRSVGAQLECTN